MKYFCDGSHKGIVMGYGVIRIDGVGNIYPKHGSLFHKKASSFLAELNAVYVAICDIPKTCFNANTDIDIYVDNHIVFNLFQYAIFPKSYSEYVQQIYNDYIDIIMAGKNIYFHLVEDDNIFYHNIAHSLSRKYLEEAQSVFTNNVELLFDGSYDGKKSINLLTKHKGKDFIEIINIKRNKRGRWVGYIGENSICMEKTGIEALYSSIKYAQINLSTTCLRLSTTAENVLKNSMKNNFNINSKQKAMEIKRLLKLGE